MLFNLVCTAVILLVLIFISIYQARWNADQLILEKEVTYSWKSIFAIIIIFVHIPMIYQNPLQDLIGSFAYIGVSFFCMCSAYGIKYSVEHKQNYLNHFWRHRLSEILLPLLFIVCIDIVWHLLKIEIGYEDSVFIKYDSIYGWIRILLLFYFEFYIIYFLIAHSKSILYKYRDFILCLVIFIQSLFENLYGKNFIGGWDVERIGFIVGIIIYKYRAEISRFLTKNIVKKIIFLFAATGIMGILYIKYKSIHFGGSFVLRSLLEITFLLLIVTFSLRIRLSNRWLIWGGKISYEIYLVHPAMFVLLMGLPQTLTSGAFILLEIVSTIVAASFIYYAIRFLRNMVSR